MTSLSKNIDSLKHLEKLATKCETVIACRLSQIQKSLLVRMMKSADSSNLTEAICDGGNDVSMPQEAHVGLAIIGKEGTAAAQASDFAFTKIKFLRRAFLVHGHWYYVRASFLIQFSFYKNVAYFTGQLFYMFFSNYNAQTLFESAFLVLYNTLYTSVPVMIYAVLDQNLPETTLMSNPSYINQLQPEPFLSNLKYWCNTVSKQLQRNLVPILYVVPELLPKYLLLIETPSSIVRYELPDKGNRDSILLTFPPLHSH